MGVSTNKQKVTNPIPLFRPVIREEAIQAANEVMRSGWLGLGPRTKSFEDAFAIYTGAPYCVGLNSCTSALHLGLHLLNLPSGSEVITSALTFVSTNHAILYESCRPAFADIERHTGNLDIRSVETLINERTKAIILVHYGGYPCDLDAFYALARRHSIPIIEDCAHACGASYKGKRIGSHGDIHAFSFHPVKNLPTGDGGALTVRSAEHDERLRALRWMGISADTYQRNNADGYRWAYDVKELGYKYYMNDLQAAIGEVQLKWLDHDNARRAAIANAYRQQLAGVSGIQLLEYDEDRSSSNHLFCILAEGRDALTDRLRGNQIDVGVHYYRNDRYPMYEECELPHTEWFSQRVVSLPMHLGLTDGEVEYITETIRKGW